MKKLLIVTDAWFPQVNGVSTALEQIRINAEALGYAVSIVHPGQFTCVPFFIYIDQPLAFFPRHKLKQIILKERPDFIHIATEWTMGYSARSICRRWNIPFTTSYHTNMSAYVRLYFPIIAPLAARLAVRYMRWFHNAATATLVSSPTMRKELAAAGFTKIAPWKLGVDTELFSPARAHENTETDIPSNAPIFTYVGRIAKEKNVEEFLDAKLPGTKLVIGDGPELARLQEQYVGRAQFLGCKRGVELARLLAHSNVLVFPSRSETFGLVMIEALASGVPVAAHTAVGPQDVITHGVDGCLDDDLARGALACLSLSSELCRKKSEQFSWKYSTELFLEALPPSTIRSLPIPPRPLAHRFPTAAFGLYAISYVGAFLFAMRSMLFVIKDFLTNNS